MDKELEETIKYLKAMRVIDFDKLGFVYAKETIDEVLNLIKEQQEENTQKDKLIDLMLEEYEYNERINIKYFCDEEIRKNTCIQDCKLCIKQYFEKKVEDKLC